MRMGRRWLAGILAVAGLALTGCTQVGAEGARTTGEPATVAQVAGTAPPTVTLTARAAERLGIQTAPVLVVSVVGEQRVAVPYGALLYDSHGETWVYTNPTPLVFIRHQITVDYIEGDRAVLTDGPPEGTLVVTVGAAELYGAELGVGK